MSVTWNTIDCAPKDGSEILIYDSGSIKISRWIDDVYVAQGGRGGPSGWFSDRYRDNWGDEPILDNPSHWMSLPEEPE